MTTALVGLAACGGRPDASPETPDTVADMRPVASVSTVPATNETLSSWIFGEGTVRSIEREFLSFESAGRVAWLDPDLKEGDRVEAGQLLAYQQADRTGADVARARAGVTDAETGRSVAEATLREAEANLALAQKTFERFETLLAQRSASQQEYDDARARLDQARAARDKAKRQVDASGAAIASARAGAAAANVTASETRLKAPISGVIARINIEQGAYFSPQQVQIGSDAGLLNTIPIIIIDPTAFEMRVDLPSFQSRAVTKDARVIIEPNVQLPGNVSQGAGTSAGKGPSNSPYAVDGTVYAVSPSVNPDTRTFSVTVRTAEETPTLQDGEFVTTWIEGPSAANALTLPLNAVRYRNDETFVFVVDAQGKATRHSITTGLQSATRLQVLSGISAGDRVVTEGRSEISDGDIVRVIGK